VAASTRDNAKDVSPMTNAGPLDEATREALVTLVVRGMHRGTVSRSNSAWSTRASPWREALW
jgi:hypothetical protein